MSGVRENFIMNSIFSVFVKLRGNMVSIISIIASIAQLGERQTEDLKVTGSIPVGGSFLELFCVCFF